MPIRTVTIYEVPNSYVTTGGTVTILDVLTMRIDDDDPFLNATEVLDPGTPQILTADGTAVGSYEFFYDDNSTIDGTAVTIKTFQLMIGGVTRSFIMNDVGGSIPGAGIGSTLTLVSFVNYTPIDYDFLPCFTKGTMIRSADGDRLIEDLKIGDLVCTLDHGDQPIRWIGASEISHRDLLSRPHLRPVRIAAGSIGPGLPERDLVVSPQHRLLVEGRQVELFFGLEQALAPALSHVGRDGIAIETSPEGVVYYHMMFDHHEIVFSEGLATESFLVGDTIRDGMDDTQLSEILEIFPELAGAADCEVSYPARPILKTFEARAMCHSG